MPYPRALLTARVCQLYPNAAAGHILQKFFVFYDFWKWPSPILLTSIQKDQFLSLSMELLTFFVLINDRSYMVPRGLFLAVDAHIQLVVEEI
eukprot:341577-Amorphochlora_amoeboformis.AAC.1